MVKVEYQNYEFIKIFSILLFIDEKMIRYTQTINNLLFILNIFLFLYFL